MAELYRSASGREEVRRWCAERLDSWPVAHERRVVPTSLGDTHLLIAGEGKRTVLYLPGTNFAAATSLPVIEALSDGHRVVVADLPGQPGLSAGGRPTGNRSAAYGAWADEVVAGLDVERPVLIGHSLGGAVALAAAPTGIAALLLLDPAGLVRLRVGMAVLGSTVGWLARPTAARSAGLLVHLHGAGRVPSEAAVEWMTLIARHTRTSIAPGPLPAQLVQRWRTVPRAVLSGAQDCFLPVDRLAPAVRRELGVDLQSLDDAGHLLPEERPDAVVQALYALVRSSP